MDYEARLQELGLVLPPSPKPIAAYIPAVRVGNLLFLSGIIPSVNGTLPIVGKLGLELTVEQGREAARIALLNALAVIKTECGSLDAVKQIVRMAIHVASESEFTDQSKVADGASDLLVEIFGEKGRHARLSLGAVSLPVSAPIELELIIALYDPSPNKA